MEKGAWQAKVPWIVRVRQDLRLSTIIFRNTVSHTKHSSFSICGLWFNIFFLLLALCSKGLSCSSQQLDSTKGTIKLKDGPLQMGIPLDH